MIMECFRLLLANWLPRERRPRVNFSKTEGEIKPRIITKEEGQLEQILNNWRKRKNHESNLLRGD
jgi:hypothetical protein